mmetsp:Transcript_26286/g.56864  ORF Transcript_26286/g.56864 Transcript_26286/m.56864 type:complete len:119 (-) Transcript_26286:559-915(-)
MARSKKHTAPTDADIAATADTDDTTGAAAAATAAADGAVTGAAPVVMVAGVVIKPEPQYIEKAPGKKVVSNAYLDQKIAATEKVRATRSLSREERKQQRLGDPDLRQRQRTTVSGAEY